MRKHNVTKAVLMVLTFLAFASRAQALEKIGVSATPGFSGFEVGYRLWGSGFLGWQQEVGFSWNFRTLYTGIKPMFRFKKSESKNLYAFLVAGLFRSKYEDEYGQTNLSAIFAGAGVGIEFLLGYNRTWGVAPEIAFGYGEATGTMTYNWNGYRETYTATYKFPPVLFGVQITKYLF